MKVLGFSKSGKLTAKIILGIIICFLSLLGILSLYIGINQFKKYDGYNVPSWMRMGVNFACQHNLFGCTDYLEVLMGEGYQDRVIDINEKFSEWEGTGGKKLYLKIPTDSLSYRGNDIIEGVNERGENIVIGKSFDEIKIEVELPEGSIQPIAHYLIANNSKYSNFWEYSSEFIRYAPFGNHLQEKAKESEKKCIIITPHILNTKELQSTHEGECEYRPFLYKEGYDEVYFPLHTFATYKDEEYLLPKIKITKITAEIPYKNDYVEYKTRTDNSYSVRH